jgi:FkbM family methyltransferase
MTPFRVLAQRTSRNDGFTFFRHAGGLSSGIQSAGATPGKWIIVNSHHATTTKVEFTASVIAGASGLPPATRIRTIMETNGMTEKRKAAISLSDLVRNTGTYQRYSRWRKSVKRAFEKKKKMKGMARFYRQFVGKDSVCFDIGANIGNRTEVFLQLGARVVAVEPQADCLQVLRQKFGSSDRVSIVAKAIDAQPGTKELFVGHSSTLASMSTEWIDRVSRAGRFEGHKWERRIVVPTTTIGELIRQYGVPAFCKIDVEGYEYPVLQGLAEPLPALSFEYTADYAESTLKCIAHLAGLGMRTFNYSVGETLRFVLPAWVDAEEMMRIIREYPASAPAAGDIYCRG